MPALGGPTIQDEEARSAVSNSLEAWVGRWLPAWMDRVRGNAGAIVAAALLVTVAAAVYTARNLEINTEEDSLFDESLPYRAVEIEYNGIFPNLYENVVVLVDARNPDQARDAAATLAAKLEASPDLFSNVYLPESDFFEEHALLYMDTEELEDFADRLARVQPYLGSLAEDGSLRGLVMMLARGIRALRDGDVSEANLAPMLERVDAAMQARLAGEPYHLSWAEVVAGRPLDQANRRLILIQPIRDFSELVAAGKPLKAVRRYAEELGLTEENGVTVRMTGDVALAYEEMGLVEGQATAAGIASFVLVAGLLMFALRSVRLVLAALLSLIVGLVLTGLFATLAIGHLNLLSVAFAVLFIGLGIDFGVHLCMGYQESLARGLDHPAALRDASGRVGGSLFLCAITTAIGFYVFTPTDFSGVAELGLISGTGMFVSLFCSFTVLPALLCFRLQEGSAERAAIRARANLVPTFPTRHPVAVAVVTVVVAVGAMALLPQAHFDRNPLLVRDPTAESVQAFEELLAEAHTSPWSLNAVRPDLASARALADALEALSTVETARTVTDFVPRDQKEKLDIIEDVAVFLAPVPNGSAPPASTHGDVIAALRDFETELGHLIRDGVDGSRDPLPASAISVRDSLASFLAELESESPESARETLAALEESLVAALPRQLDLIHRAVAVGPVTLDELPEDLVSRMISASGMYRVRIFPSEDLTDAAALEGFVTSVRELAPRATGSAVAIYSASNEVVRSLQQAFSAAVVAIAILLLLIWRTIGDTAMVMAPMILAGLLTTAGAVLVGVPFNFADVIVMPLLLGIGVDTSIHLVHRSRTAPAGSEQLLQTSTANAVVFSAATTIASFGSLAFATHRGMASLGQLLTLGVSLTVLCNLVVLPALLELRARRHRRRGTRAGTTLPAV
jgi:hopanoid biosynthesis associated RND transporter like protein HpnN